MLLLKVKIKKQNPALDHVRKVAKMLTAGPWARISSWVSWEDTLASFPHTSVEPDHISELGCSLPGRYTQEEGLAFLRATNWVQSFQIVEVGSGVWGGIKSEDFSVEVSRPGRNDLLGGAAGSDSKQSQTEAMESPRNARALSSSKLWPTQAGSTAGPDPAETRQYGRVANFSCCARGKT